MVLGCFINKKLMVLGSLIRKLMFVVVVIVCWMVCWYIIIVIMVGVLLFMLSRVEKLFRINVKIVLFMFLGILKISLGFIMNLGKRKYME